MVEVVVGARTVVDGKRVAAGSGGSSSQLTAQHAAGNGVV